MEKDKLILVFFYLSLLFFFLATVIHALYWDCTSKGKCGSLIHAFKLCTYKWIR